MWKFGHDRLKVPSGATFGDVRWMQGRPIHAVQDHPGVHVPQFHPAFAETQSGCPPLPSQAVGACAGNESLSNNSADARWSCSNRLVGNSPVSGFWLSTKSPTWMRSMATGHAIVRTAGVPARKHSARWGRGRTSARRRAAGRNVLVRLRLLLIADVGRFRAHQGDFVLAVPPRPPGFRRGRQGLAVATRSASQIARSTLDRRVLPQPLPLTTYAVTCMSANARARASVWHGSVPAEAPRSQAKDPSPSADP